MLYSYNGFLLFFWNIQLELFEDKIFFLEATIGSRQDSLDKSPRILLGSKPLYT